MTDYRTQYPTRGDLAREQLRQRGIPYFGDVQQEVYQRLTMLSSTARKVFALGCAERVLLTYKQVSGFEQNEAILQWQSLLASMWFGLTQPQASIQRRIQTIVDNLDTDADDQTFEELEEMAQDVVAVNVSAAQCYLSASLQPAYDAASGAIDIAFRVADIDLQLDSNDFEWNPYAKPIPLAQEAMHAAVQAELQAQLRGITLLEQNEITAELLAQIRQSSVP